MSTNADQEIWKKLVIPNLNQNEKYEISNCGRIKSFKSFDEGYIVKNSIVRGYHVLVLKMKNNKSSTKYVHKLVAEHFLTKDNPLQHHVIHLDFDKDNNHLSNLKWVTRQTMFAHQKLNPNKKRGVAYNAKLRETDVMRLKLKIDRQKNKLSHLAKEFGISQTQLCRIKNGDNWANVKTNI
jgi:hypothetical protein